MPRKIPQYKERETPLPEVSEGKMEAPEITTTKTPPPPIGEQTNIVDFAGEKIELKPTKLKYQRDRTAAFYRILQQMPLVDILALQDGILDPERSSDKMLFDWLIAVTDDAKLVTENYDDIDSGTIEEMLKIFLRLNHIEEKERKNRQAQATNP